MFPFSVCLCQIEGLNAARVSAEMKRWCISLEAKMVVSISTPWNIKVQRNFAVQSTGRITRSWIICQLCFDKKNNHYNLNELHLLFAQPVTHTDGEFEMHFSLNLYR